MPPNQSDPLSFASALSNFEAMERELGLSSWLVHGVYVWRLIRVPVFRAYLQAQGLAGIDHPDKVATSESGLKTVWHLLAHTLFRNPFLLRPRKVERVVMPHSRKRMHEGELVDPISIRAWAGCLRESSLILDSTSANDNFRLPGSPNNYAPLALGGALGMLTNFRLSRDNLIQVGEIQLRLSKTLTIRNFDLGLEQLSLEELLVRRAKYFLGMRRVYRSLFRVTKPKALYLVSGLGREAAIAAAQDLGISTAEFQHGSMSRESLSYHFEGWEYVPYFPDHLLVWGPEWLAATTIPSTCRIHSVGAPHIEDSISASRSGTVRKERTLLVLSQGPVRSKLLSAVGEFANMRPDWMITIRPHPSESTVDFAQELEKLAPGMAKKIQIDSLRSLAEASAEASIVFGVSSTAIIEAIKAGCRAAVLSDRDFPDSFQGLIKSGDVTQVSGGYDLAHKIDNLPSGSTARYFAKIVKDVTSIVEH